MSGEVADDLADIRSLNSRRGPRCQTAVIFSAMDPKMLETVGRALQDPAIERRAIHRWLVAKGIPLSWYSFEHHTSGDCRCER